MRPEQLQAARTAHWRQAQSPLLTLDDAESWMRQHPLCLYLPRPVQLPVPAPSLVEACLGQTQANPSGAAIEPAQALLARLIASGSVVALNLLGTVGEQPDFLAHREALPYVLALRAGPQHAPRNASRHQLSPLVLELGKILDQAGVLSAAQAREALGREITEAAVLRALCELWQAMRISPIYPGEPGQPAAWEMLRLRHREALAAGGSMSQVTALSLLVSMYLQSVYAATSEEIEIFLSPLASRSRVREAVRGLSATRQIQSLSMDARTYYFLEAGLPEFAETTGPPEIPGSAAKSSRPTRGQDLGQNPGQIPATSPARLLATPRPRSGSVPIVDHPAAGKSRPQFAAAQPAARAEQKHPGSRPPWAPAVKPRAGGEQRGSREQSRDKRRPAAENRPVYPADRSRSYSRPNPPRPSPRRPGSPDGGSESHDGERPAAKRTSWAPRQKPATSPRWTKPASRSSRGPRPLSGGVSHHPLVPHGQRVSEVRNPARPPAPPFRPVDDKSHAGRPAFPPPGSPSAAPSSSRQPPNAFRSRPRPGGWGKFAPGGRPRGERPALGKSGLAKSGPGKSGPGKSGPGKSGPGKTGRPASTRPSSAVSWTQSGPASTPPSFPRSSPRPSPGSRPASSSPTRPSRSSPGFWSRGSAPAGKPGSFPGRKLEGQKPGFKRPASGRPASGRPGPRRPGPKKSG